MQQDDRSDWMDRTAKGVDALLTVRGISAVSVGVLATQGLLLLLLGAGWPGLAALLDDVFLNLGLDLLPADLWAVAAVATSVFAAVAGVICLWALHLADPRAPVRRIVAALVLLPLLPLLLGPQWVAWQVGMDGGLRTSAGFSLGIALALVWLERRR